MNQDPLERYEVVKEPATSASPGGWHTTANGSTTTTAGNNAIAYKGLDTRQTPINLPDGVTTMQTKESSPNNNYDYPYDKTQSPIVDQNVNAARVNAFYVVNSVHDITVSILSV